MVYNDGTIKAAPSEFSNPPREITLEIGKNPPKIDMNSIFHIYVSACVVRAVHVPRIISILNMYYMILVVYTVCCIEDT